jgi:acyl dehydratase
VAVVIESREQLLALAGKEIGTSGWLEVTQDRINLFAEATDDHQWIHVDPERAKAGPFGATVAHGFLTLSLMPGLSKQLLDVRGIRLAVNYGLNKVRFPAPVRVGSRIRLRIKNLEVTDLNGAGLQLVNQMTIDVDGQDKPACVAETVVRYVY